MMNGVDDAASKKKDDEIDVGMCEHSSGGMESDVDESKANGKDDAAAAARH